MPQIILGPSFGKLDGAVRKAAYAFLEKLQESDATAGLHIEPINGSADPRVRTGRVNDFWRALLVKVQGQAAEAHYVYLGTYPHDEAIARAKTAVVRVNPRNGIAELVEAAAADTATEVAEPAAPRTGRTRPQPDDVDLTTYPLLQTQGVAVADLVDLGIDATIADAALTVETEDELLALAGRAPATWQGDALLDLATGAGLATVRDKLGLTVPAVEPDPESDDQLLDALKQPAAQMDFAFIEDDAALRAAIEDDNFGRWRVFLHPEQRDHAFKNRSGSFRLSGGAGTGKTVVLLHRARHLARKNPAARVVLTTYNRTLASSLEETLRLLDPTLPIAKNLGDPGVYVAGVDALSRRVIAKAEDVHVASAAWGETVASVLGPRSPYVLDLTPAARWEAALASAGADLAPELRSQAFLQAEYTTIVVPHRITTRDEYLRVRRPGRGVALSRVQRMAVWRVVEAYRASADAAGSTDWDEKAMVAATHLDAQAAAGVPRVADHVLVDEAQDLAPARLVFLRALVAQGPDDLFLAEDSQQRIYGQKVVLSRYGINIVGRSRRLTLNYRTTAQVLRYAVGVLAGEDWVDMEAGDAAATGYRSARSGPAPREVRASSLLDEYEQAAELVRGWRDAGDAGDAPETIGVLVRTKNTGDKVVHALSERGVKAKFIQDDASTGTGSVLVMTMHRSKGMEFKRVILFGVSSDEQGWGYGLSALPEADRADGELRERSLLYVAATRARDELAVLWNGRRSDLLPAHAEAATVS
ncbi:3'-5' exonuclease [Cellulosimicrobium protaetiae]|uniref:DNA 3'-5' helicase n=1 Tax=Cellulosimicrobium protaetiae TaxID=2587808 RepID=A0A6M5UAC5_9MICO|nr:3'-5' exonuclease [Cellulosimicrobium protaetiae]QJW35477.1 DEAD/DEAH box helicase [Cellulosimicrobium protaetiae]